MILNHNRIHQKFLMCTFAIGSNSRFPLYYVSQNYVCSKMIWGWLWRKQNTNYTVILVLIKVAGIIFIRKEKNVWNAIFLILSASIQQKTVFPKSGFKCNIIFFFVCVRCIQTFPYSRCMNIKWFKNYVLQYFYRKYKKKMFHILA